MDTINIPKAEYRRAIGNMLYALELLKKNPTNGGAFATLRIYTEILEQYDIEEYMFHHPDEKI